MAQITVDQLLQMALAHHQAGRKAEAERMYRQILAVQPNHADALHLLGLIAEQAGNYDAAIDLIGRALQINPNYAAAHCNIATALVKKGQLDAAIASLRRAVQLKPDFAEGFNNLGSALSKKEEYAEAAAAYERAIQIKPDYAEPYSNLSKVLRSRGEIDRAITFCLRAIELSPGNASAYNNLGNAYLEVGDLEKSVAAFRRGIELAPNNPMIGSNLLYAINFQSGLGMAEILAEHRAWAKRYVEPLKLKIPPHENDRDPDRRLRIGFISPEFRGMHCQSFFTLLLFAALDRNLVEIICYADVARPDAMTEKLRAMSNGWRNILGIDDAKVAETVRADRIDILVDLTMHMRNARPLVFARKPAPVQVAWLAYPGTTGIEAIDYRLTDPYLDPPGIGDEFYCEKSIRLRDTFWCVERLGEETVGDPPVERNGFVTFGCLNNFCKVNDGVLELWGRVLAETADSRIILLSPRGEHRRHVLEKLGVGAERVEFVDRQQWGPYMRTYQRIDIGLDTFPYNGHTTSLDSFWMGVPVATLVGNTVAGRAGKSQLTNLGLVELIAQTPEQFVEIATGLGRNRARLYELRRTLRNRMLSSPLCDGKRFARSMEEALREMWRKWCQA